MRREGPRNRSGWSSGSRSHRVRKVQHVSRGPSQQRNILLRRHVRILRPQERADLRYASHVWHQVRRGGVEALLRLRQHRASFDQSRNDIREHFANRDRCILHSHHIQIGCEFGPHLRRLVLESRHGFLAQSKRACSKGVDSSRPPCAIVRFRRRSCGLCRRLNRLSWRRGSRCLWLSWHCLRSLRRDSGLRGDRGLNRGLTCGCRWRRSSFHCWCRARSGGSRWGRRWLSGWSRGSFVIDLGRAFRLGPQEAEITEAIIDCAVIFLLEGGLDRRVARGLR